MSNSILEGGKSRERKIVVWTTEYRGRVYEYIETRNGVRIPLPKFVKPILEREREREKRAAPEEIQTHERE
jgi:hypothetical protein